MLNFKSERGAIGDSLMEIIGIGIAIIVMLIFPISALSERNIDMARSTLQTATSEFADKISVEGKITRSNYHAYAQRINSIVGSPVDIEIEIQHLDENIGKKNATASANLVGENTRYSSWDVDDVFKDGEDYLLNKGDIVIVKANAQKTGFLKTNPEELTASASSMIVNSGTSR